MPIGAGKFVALAGTCAFEKVFSLKHCFVICNSNQRKASDCIKFRPLMLVLPNWQLVSGNNWLRVLAVILALANTSHWEIDLHQRAKLCLRLVGFFLISQ